MPYWATGIHPLHGALRMADLPVASPPVPHELRLPCEQRVPIALLHLLPRALVRERPQITEQPGHESPNELTINHRTRRPQITERLTY